MQNLLASAGGAVQQASSIKTAFILWLVKHLTGPSWQLAVMHSIAQPCVQQLTTFLSASLGTGRKCHEPCLASKNGQSFLIITNKCFQRFPKNLAMSPCLCLYVRAHSTYAGFACSVKTSSYWDVAYLSLLSLFLQRHMAPF